MNKTFDDQRWTVEAYNDQGITVQARHAWELSSVRTLPASLARKQP